MSCKRLCDATTNEEPAAEGPIRPRAAACLPAASLLFVLLPGTSLAQQWLVTPEIEIAAQYVDNPRLQEEDGEAGTDGLADGETDTIAGGLLDAALALRRNTPTSSFLLRPAVAVYRYPDDPEEDSESYFLDLNADGEGRRSGWRLQGSYRQQQVFRGEITEADVDDFIEDDVETGTGRTFVRRQRDLWRFAPGFTVEFTELTSLDIDLNYLDVSYDTQEVGEAVDYDNTGVDAALVRALSPYNRIEFSVFASRYDPATAEPETDIAGARVGYRQSTSDISTIIVDVGAQEARTDSGVDPEIEVSETSFLWNVGYERQLEVTRWRFDLGQDVTPSGSGDVVERDRYRAIMEHQFQPRWSLQLSAVLLNTNAVLEEDAGSTSDRDYVQGRAALAYQLTRSWTVQGLYSLTHQDFEDIPGDAQEHEVRLSFIYNPPLPTQ